MDVIPIPEDPRPPEKRSGFILCPDSSLSSRTMGARRPRFVSWVLHSRLIPALCTLLALVGLSLWWSLQPKQMFRIHSDSIWSLAFSPDGRKLASASSDLTVK